jgi:hypothetical protein
MVHMFMKEEADATIERKQRPVMFTNHLRV